MPAEADAAAAAMLDLLQEEGRALREGDFDRLESLVAMKEAVIAAATPLAGADDALLRRIARQAKRNESLIAAARGGVAAAMERLGAVARAGEGLRTYDSAGQSALLQDTSRGPLRRA